MLRSHGIGAIHVGSSVTVRQVIDDRYRIGMNFRIMIAFNLHVYLVFMSPERATGKQWREFFKFHEEVALVAVDEAHCIPQW